MHASQSLHSALPETTKQALAFPETMALQFMKDFPLHERHKLVDLLHRFVMAKKYTGELQFDFQWLLTAEKEYDPLIHPELDVLKNIF